MRRHFAVAVAAAFAAATSAQAASWAVQPAQGACTARVQAESGDGVAFASDGDTLLIIVRSERQPAQAYLKVDIDGQERAAMFSRNVQAIGKMKKRAVAASLSLDDIKAMLGGSMLTVAWSEPDPTRLSLADARQGLLDLVDCGAKAHAQYAAAQEAQTARRQAFAAALSRAGAALSGASQAVPAPYAPSPAGSAESPFHTYILNGKVVNCSTLGGVTNCN